MKGMESLQDLIDEVKLRTVWWALCIFAVSYFLTRESLFYVLLSAFIVDGIHLLAHVYSLCLYSCLS